VAKHLRQLTEMFYVFIQILTIMKNITKRDVSFIFIGIFTMLIIEIIWDWKNVVQGAKDGWNESHSSLEK